MKMNLSCNNRIIYRFFVKKRETLFLFFRLYDNISMNRKEIEKYKYKVDEAKRCTKRCYLKVLMK